MTESQHTEILIVLYEIRNLLAGMAAVGEPDNPDGCQHPDETRISLATLSDPEHWVCSACKYEHHVVMS